MIKTLGHLFLGALFIYGGADSFLHPQSKAPKVADAGIPQPESAAQLNGAVMVLGGIALALDIAPKLAATMLAASLIPTTFVGHPFWKETDPKSRAGQQIHFLKNIATLGGLLLVFAEKDA